MKAMTCTVSPGWSD